MRLIKLKLGSRGYDIAISENFRLLPGLLERLKLGRNACCVTNKKLRYLFGSQLRAALKKIGTRLNFIEVPDTERSKSLSQSLRLINSILRYDRGERPFVIALGGGVVGDLAGYVASIYKRGVPYIQLPTTLLSQVDSSIGGKVGVDLPCAKNLVGSFYQPRLVYSNTRTLDSLSTRQIRNGLAEVVKYGVIKDAGLFGFLERNYEKLLNRDPSALGDIVYRSARIKARLVESDERDDLGRRVILNFGHTIGHAIEQAVGYSKRIQHGEAISLGMVIASAISARLKLLNEDTAARIKNLLAGIGLPVTVTGISAADIMEAYRFDKKFLRGINRFVLPVAVGRTIVREGIPASTIISAIEENMRA